MPESQGNQPKIFSPLFEHDVGTLLFPDRPEFSLYVGLKIAVYQRIHRLKGRVPNPLEHPALRAFTEGISARKAQRMFISRSRNPALMRSQFTDFYDLSSYFIRERLKALNHGTVLRQTGRGLRNAVNYRWNEPIDSGTLESFERMMQCLKNRLNLGIDLYRIHETLGDVPFREDAFVDAFRHLRARLTDRKWYRLATNSSPRSLDFTRFIQTRLRDLVQEGYLIRQHDATYHLTTAGKLAVHWFELFIYSVGYTTDTPRGTPPAPGRRGPTPGGRPL